MAKQKMKNMTGYSNGYTPPSGSAGKAAHGEFSHKSNPMSVPQKGSQMSGYSAYGDNADRNKAMYLEREERKKESLRGKPC